MFSQGRGNRAGAAALRLWAASAVLLAGCATTQLATTTLAQGDTVSDIEYRMVLANLAMFRTYRPATLAASPLPWQLKITQGSAEVADSINPTVGATYPPPVVATPALAATRGVTVNWTFAPETDSAHLTQLRAAYFAAASDPAFAADFAEGTKPGGKPVGRYQGLYVWPKPDHIGALTTLTLTVLADTPVEEGERPVLLPGATK
jgi:hypothetical protein